MNLVITIDGTAGSGKGTLALNLSHRLQLAYLDTGLLYRRVAYLLLQQPTPHTPAHAAHVASTLTLPIKNQPSLRSDEVSSLASQIATYDDVRAALLPLQRHFAHHPPPPHKGVVLDGRDVGSVVCPEAHAKFYLDASEKIRAQRRQQELLQRNPHHAVTTLEAVKESIQQRDSQDKNRHIAPLVVPPHAKIIDTSSLSPEETVEICLAWIKSRSTMAFKS